MRLDKYLAHNGFGTRKEVKSLIKNGLVNVNDVIVKSDKQHVDEFKDIVVCDGIEIEYEEFVYYMLNKPEGYVSANVDKTYPTVIELIDDYYRDDLFCVGRLDVDTTGLLLITNDGMLSHNLLSPKRHVDKEYIAQINAKVDESDIQAFAKGIELDDFTTHPSTLKVIEDNNLGSVVSIVIDEGKFHQVKRMFEAVDKKVVTLKRIRMKNLVLDDDLELGEYRHLTKEEIDDLKGN